MKKFCIVCKWLRVQSPLAYSQSGIEICDLCQQEEKMKDDILLASAIESMVHLRSEARPGLLQHREPERRRETTHPNSWETPKIHIPDDQVPETCSPEV